MTTVKEENTTSGNMNSNNVSSGGGRKKKRQNRSRLDKGTMEEFTQARRETLRTKDGAYCTAKDESSVICVCGKVRVLVVDYFLRTFKTIDCCCL